MGCCPIHRIGLVIPTPLLCQVTPSRPTQVYEQYNVGLLKYTIRKAQWVGAEGCPPVIHLYMGAYHQVSLTSNTLGNVMLCVCVGVLGCGRGGQQYT